ncbi:MAG: DUF4293 family protein [Chitinophagaceae bacterium]|nr:DUF4293 family protein [Chitinophagaceae bacterium]MBL0055876.1 DUF4293 family protein [Chitinophagaceae bacterium]
MIQRLQSLWLLLAAACAFAAFKFSFYSGTNAKGISPYELKGTENFLLMLSTIIVGGLALITIFLYKKRGLQIGLSILGILLQALLIFLYYREVKTFTQGTYSLTAILQLIIVVAFFMAARGIRKDEKIIKESDRLR